MKGQDPTSKEFQQLRNIERGIKLLNKKIQKMGYDVYLACGDVCIMKGPSHDEDQRPIRDNAVHSFYLDGWDGGDW